MLLLLRLLAFAAATTAAVSAEESGGLTLAGEFVLAVPPGAFLLPLFKRNNLQNRIIILVV